MTDYTERLANAESNIISDLAEIPQIKRGLVYCDTCERTEQISGANFRTGWPKCCGYTMSLDSPQERAAFRAKDGTP